MSERRTESPPIHWHPDGENDASAFRNEDVQVRPTLGRPPQPGEESAGPSLFDLVQRSHRSLEVQNNLLRAAIPLLDQRTVVEKTNGNTDTNGNLDLALYQVPQGMELTVTRVNLEAGTFTPALPFSNASAWLALIQGPNLGFGSILDFGPGAAGGPIFPSVFTDSDTEAIKLRGGQIVTLHVVGTVALASTAISARLQGFLKAI